MNAADQPSATITNNVVTVKLYLPERVHGFYQGTRFDWSGVIGSLQFDGHDYYGPWFTRTDPDVHDFIYQGNDIVAGPCSAITGPVDEFAPVGWDEAKAGDLFLKVGIGGLRKPDDQPYDNYRVYDIANPGSWQVDKKAHSVQFTQTLADASSGFGYVYRKSVELTPGKAEMVLRQSLKNSGKRAIVTTVYNHNFLVLDGKPLEAGITVTMPFSIRALKPFANGLAEVNDKQVVYLKPLQGHDTVATQIEGFGPNASDHHIRIENRALGMGMSIQGDRPLVKEFLWSIRSVIAIEPFVAVSVKPGEEFTWATTYEYFSQTPSSH